MNSLSYFPDFFCFCDEWLPPDYPVYGWRGHYQLIHHLIRENTDGKMLTLVSNKVTEHLMSRMEVFRGAGSLSLS